MYTEYIDVIAKHVTCFMKIISMNVTGG